MTTRYISLFPLQLARFTGLIRHVESFRIPGPRNEWGLRIHGRGFKRVLRDDLVIASTLIRPAAYYLPRPRTFWSKRAAERAAAHLGLRSVRNRSKPC